jgi:hypothetical protein
MIRRLAIILFIVVIALGMFFATTTSVNAEDNNPMPQSLLICRTCI